MKILWASNAPWAASGYGQQTAMFAPRIAAEGHDVALYANWGLQGAGLEWNGLRVYPSDEKWGNELLPEYARHHAGGNPEDCLVITLQDVYVYMPERVGRLNMACWTPIDHDPVEPRVLDFFAKSGATPVAMSRFGEQQLIAHGLKPHYVPHAVDTTVFYPREKTAVREALGLGKDDFVVGMVAANQGNTPPRKAFPQVFQAFADLHARRPNSKLFLHTEVTGVSLGLNLLGLADKCGVPREAVGTTDQLMYRLGFVTPNDLASIYSAMDVLVNPSYGEGFGIPIIEAQACGVPVIVSDWTAMPELCGAGWGIGGEPWYHPQHDSFFLAPSIKDLREALLEAYDGAGDLSDEAVAFAAGYDTEVVWLRHWLPVLNQLIDGMHEAPTIVEMPRPNRKQRRQREKTGAR